MADDAFDDAPNALVTMTFLDGQLASTLRIDVASGEDHQIPSLTVWPDVVVPHLRSSRVTIEATRSAARLEIIRRFPELCYIALRPAWLAAQHFEADFILATAIEQHQSFYARTFGFRAWCEPRESLHCNSKLVCMGVDFPAVKERVEARYPFFRSTTLERNTLFGNRLRQPMHPAA